MFKRLFRKPAPELITPETDLDLLNKKLCPDCGTSDWTECNDTDIRHIECIGCGSAFNVMPCTPPYLFVHHIGYNRQGRRIQSERG
jgi:acetone carboxylase gamma subunit